MDSPDSELTFGSEDRPRRRGFKHPFAVLFHLLFKTSAVLLYIFNGFTNMGLVTCYVLVILLLSMDFWTVKNITGRMLVGLRWWNKVDDSGQSTWVFESRSKTSRKHSTSAEAQIFWAAIIGTELLWVVLLFIAVFSLKFSWASLVVCSLILNGANLYGYIRCKLGSGDGASSLQSTATKYIGQSLLSSRFSPFSLLFPARPSPEQQTPTSASSPRTVPMQQTL